MTENKSENEKAQLQVESIKWMISLGLLNDPQVQNHIILNIYNVNDKIKDVQILLDTHKQKLLVHIELSWWGSFFKDIIIKDVELRVTQLLPEYKVRIINDLDLFKKAIKLIKK